MKRSYRIQPAGGIRELRLFRPEQNGIVSYYSLPIPSNREVEKGSIEDVLIDLNTSIFSSMKEDSGGYLYEFHAFLTKGKIVLIIYSNGLVEIT